MPYSILVLASLSSLAYLCHGRRVQTSTLTQFESRLSQSQSFVEVATAFTPSTPHSRLHIQSMFARGPTMPMKNPWRATSTLSSAGGDNSSKLSLNQEQRSELVLRVDQERDQSSAGSWSFGLIAVSQVLARIASGVRRGASVSMNDSSDTERKGIRFDISLWLCIVLWYVGHYYYNITNKIALVVAGGATGFPVTIATSQLFVGSLYAILLWILPDARPRPTITRKDFLKFLPIGLTSAAQQACGVFALSAGAVSFAQVVKAAEPAFAALIASALYQHPLSKPKWLCLLTLVGGVVMASFGELSFSWAALAAACLANFFAALNKNEVEKMMYTSGVKDRIGSVGNQFGITIITACLCCIPLMLFTEGHKFGAFVQLCRDTPSLPKNIIFSGIWCYMFCELATIVIKKTSAVTQSVLTSLKQAIVVVGLALVMGEHLGRLKLLGCGVSIVGAFFYAMADSLFGKIQSNDDSEDRKSLPGQANNA